MTQNTAAMTAALPLLAMLMARSSLPTIAYNTGGTGSSGIATEGTATLHLAGVLIFSNSGVNTCGGPGSLISDGYNYTDGSNSDCPMTLSATDNTAQPSSGLAGTPADNFGPTETLAIPAGSPILDKGGTGCSSFDQRGAARPFDASGEGTALCDPGAFEL